MTTACTHSGRAARSGIVSLKPVSALRASAAIPARVVREVSQSIAYVFDLGDTGSAGQRGAARQTAGIVVERDQIAAREKGAVPATTRS